MSLYEYLKTSPVSFSDPYGLAEYEEPPSIRAPTPEETKKEEEYIANATVAQNEVFITDLKDTAEMIQWCYDRAKEKDCELKDTTQRLKSPEKYRVVLKWDAIDSTERYLQKPVGDLVDLGTSDSLGGVPMTWSSMRIQVLRAYARKYFLACHLLCCDDRTNEWVNVDVNSPEYYNSTPWDVELTEASKEYIGLMRDYPGEETPEMMPDMPAEWGPPSPMPDVPASVGAP